MRRVPNRQGTWVRPGVAADLAGVAEDLVKEWMRLDLVPTDRIRGETYTDLDAVRMQAGKGVESCG